MSCLEYGMGVVWANCFLLKKDGVRKLLSLPFDFLQFHSANHKSPFSSSARSVASATGVRTLCLFALPSSIALHQLASTSFTQFDLTNLSLSLYFACLKCQVLPPQLLASSYIYVATSICLTNYEPVSSFLQSLDCLAVTSFSPY